MGSALSAIPMCAQRPSPRSATNVHSAITRINALSVVARVSRTPFTVLNAHDLRKTEMDVLRL